MPGYNTILDRYRKHLANKQISTLRGLYGGIRQTYADERRDAYLEQRRAMGQIGASASTLGLGQGYIDRKQMDYDAQLNKYSNKLDQAANSQFESAVRQQVAENKARARRARALAAQQAAQQSAYDRQRERMRAQSAQRNFVNAITSEKATFKPSQVAEEPRYNRQLLDLLNELDQQAGGNPNNYVPSVPKPSQMPRGMTDVPDGKAIYTPQNAPKYGKEYATEMDKAQFDGDGLAGEIYRDIRAGKRTEQEIASEMSRMQKSYESIANALNDTARAYQSMVDLKAKYDEYSAIAGDMSQPVARRLEAAKAARIYAGEYAKAKQQYDEYTRQYGPMSVMGDAYSQYTTRIDAYGKALKRFGYDNYDIQLMVNGVEIPRVSRDPKFWEMVDKITFVTQEPIKAGTALTPGFKPLASARFGGSGEAIKWLRDNGYGDILDQVIEYVNNLDPRQREALHEDPTETVGRMLDAMYGTNHYNWYASNGYFTQRALNDSLATALQAGDGNDAEFLARLKGITYSKDNANGPEVKVANEEWFKDHGYGDVLDILKKGYSNAISSGEIDSSVSFADYAKEKMRDNYITPETRSNVATVVRAATEGGLLFGLFGERNEFRPDHAASEDRYDLARAYLETYVNALKAQEKAANGKQLTDEEYDAIESAHEWDILADLIKNGNEQQARLLAVDLLDKWYLADTMRGGSDNPLGISEDSIFYDSGKKDPLGIKEWALNEAYAIANHFTKNEEYASPVVTTGGRAKAYATKYAENTRKKWQSLGKTDDAKKFLGNAADIWTSSWTSVADNLPALAANFIPVVGQAIGGAMFFGSAAGGAYQEALRAGADPVAARQYGVAIGASETCLEKILGGIPIAGKGMLGNVLKKFAENLPKAWSRVLAEVGVDMVGEFTEEYLQEVLDPLFKNMLLNEKNNIKFFSVEALKAGLSGALSAGIHGAGGSFKGMNEAYTNINDMVNLGLSRKQAEFVQRMNEIQGNDNEKIDVSDGDWERYNDYVVCMSVNDALIKQFGDDAELIHPVEDVGQYNYTPDIKQGEKVDSSQSYMLNYLTGNREAAEQELLHKAASYTDGKLNVVTVDGNVMNRATMTPQQKALYALAQQMSNAYDNVKIYLHDTLPASNGYNENAGEIHIALDAETSYANKAASYVLSHEFSHLLKNNSVEAWNELRKVLEDRYKTDTESNASKNAVVIKKAKDIAKNAVRESRGVKDENAELGELTEKEQNLYDDEYVAALIEQAYQNPEDLKTLLDSIMEGRDIPKAQVKGLKNKFAALGDKMSKVFSKLGRKVPKEVKAFNDAIKSAFETVNQPGMGVERMEADRQAGIEREARTQEKEIASNMSEGGKVVGDLEIDNNGNVNRFSIRTTPQTEEGWDNLVNDMVAAGFTEEQAKAWIDDMRSVAAEIMDAQEFLDYENDPRSSWFRKNAEYTQGTIDFSNNCPRRAEFTAQFDALMKQFPNFAFTAEDYETIRTIIKDAGIAVTCGGCYVEERRQHLSEIGQLFLDKYHAALNGETGDNALAKKFFDKISEEDKKYDITLDDIVSSDSLRKLYDEHPTLYKAFKDFNNARGMAAARLVYGLSEYNNQIQKWNKGTITRKNNLGGLRIFSYSDADPRIILDVMQIITDSASKGLMMQGYTKKPWFAVFMKNTGARLLRSHIPMGTGYKMVKGQMVLDFDNFEGINTKDMYYSTLDRDADLNIGNNVIGINDTQIRLAMVSDIIDQIIPFHTGLKKSILHQKKLEGWNNYRDYQTDKAWAAGDNGEYKWRTVKKGGINLYTDIINAIDWSKTEARADGSPMTDAERFVNKYLDICREKGFKPRFAQFLCDENGNELSDYGDDHFYIEQDGKKVANPDAWYTYNPGYEKFLVDFRLFDKNGKIIEQNAVAPNFDNEFVKSLFSEYIKENPQAKPMDKGVQTKIVDAMKEKYGDELNSARRSARATDAEYLSLAEKYREGTATEKEKAELERQVREAANQAMPNTKILDEGGNPLIVYHGTSEQFTVFDKTKGRANMDIQGMFFSPWELDASGYGENVGKYYLNITNPAPEGVAYKALNKFKGKNNAGVKARQYLESLGYDGVNNSDEEYIAFNASQIKSADPVTYDSEGNIIPLSERFNEKNEDIRYSKRIKAEEKRDAGEKLTESQFYSVYAAHKLDLRGKGNIEAQIKNIKEEGFKGYGGFGNNIMPTRQFTSYPTIDKYNILLELENKGVFESGYAEKYKAELGDEYGKPVPSNLSEKAYGPRKGEWIMFVPRSGIEHYARGAERVLPGYKPAFDYEFVQADYDFQPYYEMYSKAYDEYAKSANSRHSLRSSAKWQSAPLIDTKAVDEAVKKGKGTVEGRFEVNVDKSSNGFTVEITDKQTGKTYTDSANIEDNENVTAKAERYTASMILNIKDGDPNSDYRGTEGIYIKKGENPVRDVNIPVFDVNGDKVRRFMRTVEESGAIPDDMVDDIKKDIMAGGESYKPISNKSALAYADGLMQHQLTAQNEWNKVKDSYKIPKPGDIALGERLLKAAAQAGNTQDALKFAAELSDMLTRAGQAIQAARLLKQMGSAAEVYYITRAVSRINADLAKTAQAYNVELNEDLVQKLVEAQTDEDRDKAKEEIFKDIARQIKPTLSEKLNSWRYLAMLFNVRTHVRNFIGNAAMMPAANIRYLLASSLEAATVHRENRTKTLTVGKEYKTFAEDDWKSTASKAVKSRGNKYQDLRNEIDEYRKIFKGPLEVLRKFNGRALETEDMLYKQAYYRKALAGYLAARKVDIKALKAALAAEKSGKAIIKGSQEDRLIEQYVRAQAYAINEANVFTYNDANRLASVISEASRTLRNGGGIGKAGHLLIEGILPFKNTPANILGRAIDFSPLGYIRTASSAISKAIKHEYSSTEFIDNLSRNMVGTMVMAIGFALGKAGLLTGALGYDDDDKDKKRTGHQSYALEVGNTSITLDWLAPMSIPLFAGVELYNVLQEAKVSDENMWRALKAAVTGSLEPLINLSMLEGVQGAFETVKYSETPLIDLAATLGTNYLTQYIPTLSGQFARSIDPYQRRKYTGKANFLTPIIDSFVQNVLKKIPGANRLLQPYVNEWGEKESNFDKRGPAALTDGRFWLNALENFISPSYINTIKETAPDGEIARLLDSLGEEALKAIPSAANKSISYDGTKYNLTAEEYTAYAEMRGQTSYALVQSMIGTDAYNRLTDAEKVEAMVNAYKYADAVAKSAYLEAKLGKDAPALSDVLSWAEKANGFADIATDKKGAIGTFICIRDTINDDNFVYGKLSDYIVTDSKGNEKIKRNDMKWDYINSLKLSTAEKLYLADALNIKEGAYSDLQSVKAAGISDADYQAAFNKYHELTETDYRNKETMTSEEYAEWKAKNANAFEKYLDSTKLTGEQKFALMGQIVSEETAAKAKSVSDSYGIKMDALWIIRQKVNAGAKAADLRQYVNGLVQMNGKQKFAMLEYASPSTNWYEQAEEAVSKCSVSYELVWRLKMYAEGESGTGKKARIKAFAEEKLGVHGDKLARLLEILKLD